MKSFNDPSTIGELMVQLEAYGYSNEYMEIMKESFELQLMERMAAGKEYIQESGQLNHTIAGCLYSESVAVDTGFMVMLEAKQGGLLSRVWTAIKKFFRWVGDAFTKLFTGKSQEQIELGRLDLGNDDLAEELREMFGELQKNIFTISSGSGKDKTEIKFKIGGAGEGTSALIKRAVKFVNEGLIEIAIPENTALSNFEAIGSIFNQIQGKIGNGNVTKPEADAIKKLAADAIVKIEAVSSGFTRTPKRISLDEAKAATDKIKKYVSEADLKEGKHSQENLYKTGKGTNVDGKISGFTKTAGDMGGAEVGAAVSALNELNAKWAEMCKDSLKVYGEIVKFREKARGILKRYEEAGGESRKKA